MNEKNFGVNALQTMTRVTGQNWNVEVTQQQIAHHHHHHHHPHPHHHPK